MEYQHSKEVDGDCYEMEGLGIHVAPRIHKDLDLEARAGYKGGLGPRYHFMSITIPECLPERLECISYANEFAFLYDDELEKLDAKQYLKDNADLLETFGDALNYQKESHPRAERKIQAKIVRDMVNIDPDRAAIMINSWATFVQSANRQRAIPYQTLDEYIPARVIDCGELIWYGFVTFGMALTIPDSEYELCCELAKPAYAALGLTNDLFSWAKERDQARRDGLDHVFNAIDVIMTERAVGEEEAKDICKAEIREWISKHLQIVERTLNDDSLSKDLRIYLQALTLSYVGNIGWSIECPRYQEC